MYKRQDDDVEIIKIDRDMTEVSNNFSNNKPKISPFKNSGVMINGKISTIKVFPDYDGACTLLGDVLIDEKEVSEEFFIDKKSIKQWEALKGSKKEERKSKSGHIYYYSEGAMTFPDALDRPSRTIVTGEGGSSPSRFKHIIKTKSGRLRRLTPLELERLNMFPNNHTIGAPNQKRAFIMGNALVVGVIKGLGKSLRDAI